MRPPPRSPNPLGSLPSRARSGEGRSLSSAADRDDVREGRERDLLRRLRAEVETDRCVHAGERLPQKTTYFYPKVPAGLVVRPLD